MTPAELKKTLSALKPTLLDRLVSYIDPARGLKRFKNRVGMAMAGAYTGASKSRRSMSTWNPTTGSADADTLWDLPTLRERSRDLVRNNPHACGAISIKEANVVGTGLRLNSQIDANYLGMNGEQADEWQANTEREFKLWAESVDCDVSRGLNFYGLEALVFRSAIEGGDCFTLPTYIERKNSPYSLALQIIEAERCSNPGWKMDSSTLAGGVEKDSNGAPLRYYFMDQHPGAINRSKTEWTPVTAFGETTGRRNVLHHYRKMRPGQSRGVPDLAPVIEAFKQLGDYTEAELTAAVVAGMFTVFVHTEGDYSLDEIAQFQKEYGSSADGELKMGGGSVVGLGVNEKVDIANPGRPNQAFDPFIMAILRQVGAALEIPFEVLVMQFNSSYSASKAAIESAWTFFRNRRKWLADSLCRPVYEMWMIEAVSLGRIRAPGFLRDPAIRAAYLGADWIGPAKPVLDLVKEANGRKIMEDMGWVTGAENTIELTGGDWDRKHNQRTREHQKRVEADLEPSITVVETAAEPDEDDNGND